MQLLKCQFMSFLFIISHTDTFCFESDDSNLKYEIIWMEDNMNCDIILAFGNCINIKYIILW